MGNENVSEIVKREVNKILGYLESKYEITLSELSHIQYGVKYEVKRKKLDTNIGILVIYHGKKGFKLTREKVIYKEDFDKIEEVFNNRDNLKEPIIEDLKLDKLYEILKNSGNYQIYEELKPYSNEKFDFSDFADELLKYFDNNEEKKCIKENIYNFKELEKFYNNVKGGK